MPLKPGIVQDNTITDRIRNQKGAGEGTSFPPRMQGGIRVPTVSNFKALKTEGFLGGTQVTLSWDTPVANATLPIDGFLISVKGIQSGTADVNMAPVFTKTSPCVIRIMSSIATVAIISIQTKLNNGQTSLLDISPTVSVQTIAPEITSSDLASSTDLVLGQSNLTVAGGITYVSGTGTITEDASNIYYDATNKRIGMLTTSPKSTIHDTGSLGLKVSSQTTSFTAGNAVVYLCNCTSGNITVTLPSASTVVDRIYIFKKTDSSTNTLTVNSWAMANQNESLVIVSDGSNWINLIHSVT